MNEFPLGAVSRLRMGTDGTGITTLAAARGCPLSCTYCLNPLLLEPKKGSGITVPELIARVRQDHLYYIATGGGITFGGGEPLLHSAFIAEFCETCPPEWNITIETALFVPASHIPAIAKTRAFFLVDIKTLDPDIYVSYTGKPLDLALSNLKLLLELAGPDRITVRVPVIPGFVSPASQEKTCALLQEMGIVQLDRFTYRKPSALSKA